jgi:hypothetical protein
VLLISVDTKRFSLRLTLRGGRLGGFTLSGPLALGDSLRLHSGSGVGVDDDVERSRARLGFYGVVSAVDGEASGIEQIPSDFGSARPELLRSIFVGYRCEGVENGLGRRILWLLWEFAAKSWSQLPFTVHSQVRRNFQAPEGAIEPEPTPARASHQPFWRN